MAYKVQVFHPESGFFLNTNHASENLEELKALVASGVFDGIKYRIVDGAGEVVPLDYTVREKKTTPTVEDIARMLGVPVKDRFEL